MVKFRLSIIVFFVVCMLGAGGADAGDGHHSKSVCDKADLVGAAYAACHTYCEDLKCDGPLNRSRARACAGAFDRFWDLMGEAPPCDPICPCATGWMNPEFIPANLTAAVCEVQINDGGELIDLRLEGVPGAEGDAPLSAANVSIFDDDVWGFHSTGCFSERYEDPQGPPSEDSGNFEMFTSFRDEGKIFDRKQRKTYRSCKRVLLTIIEETGTECTVDDTRSD